jgi:hypothetical protein
MSTHQENKKLVLEYFAEMDAARGSAVADVLRKYVSDDYEFLGVHPFNELKGADAVAETVWRPLHEAWSRVQRRQDVFIAGTSSIRGDAWVMSMGQFLGVFERDWLGIRPTRKAALLRYAEFNRVEGGRILRTAFHCDIIGVMQQAGMNPLPPQTGATLLHLGPRTRDGVVLEAQPEEEGAKTLAVVNRMVDDLTALNVSGHDRCPPEVLQRSWHDDMIWYGPAGIGTSYTIPVYQAQHQYPFREGLKDKVFNGHVCRFAEGRYACFFGWPNLTNTPAGGFMGLPGGVRADMRVVDVYRRDGDRLAENWVFIDIPYWLKQQGLDLLERTRSVLNP